MKKLQIFEPAMCCSTGLCGVGVDPELLRISTVLDMLKKNGIVVERFNLSNAPEVFVTNNLVNSYIQSKGVDGLPIVVLDDEIIIAKRYPSNNEFIEYLNLEQGILSEQGNCDCSENTSETCCSSSENAEECCSSVEKASGNCCCADENCC